MVVRFGFASALLVACAALLLTAGSAPAGEGSVKVLSSVPFEDEDVASKKVRDGCELQTKVPHFLSEYSDKVELVDGPLGKSGRVLELGRARGQQVALDRCLAGVS